MSLDRIDTVAEAARLVRAGEVSPTELVSSALDRIEEHDGLLNGFITVCDESALNDAKERERELSVGPPRSVLHGLPFCAKDVFLTADVRTTAGSRLLGEFIPTASAVVVDRLVAAGAVLVGKNNCHEFHAGATNVNEHYGTCRNPLDTSRISGGSSGGSAAAVAASMSLFSIGTDTGGSVRIPSALCGVVGFKPTFGLLSTSGIIPESWSCDHIGTIAGDVAGAAIVADLLRDTRAGESVRDRGDGWDSLFTARPEAVAGKRVGVIRPLDAQPEILSVFDRAIADLGSIGLVLDPFDDPLDWDLVAAVLQSIIWAEAASYHREWLTNRPGDYSTEVRWKLESGLLQPAVDYLHAQRLREWMRVQLLKNLPGRFDVIVEPTVSIVAPTVEAAESASLDFQAALELENELARYTPLASLLGLPSITVPCGLTTGGLPVGLMITGPKDRDATVLEIAGAYEAETTWSDSGQAP